MKKALKSLVVFTFCICMIMSTMIMASAVSKVTGAKATNITYNSATLTWKKASGADGYEIQQYSNKKWKTVKTIKSGSTVTYKVTKLTTGKSYKYRVRAYDKRVFKTEYSAYVNINVKPLPANVKNLKSASTSYNTVKLTWGKVAGATGYQVQRKSGKKWVNVKNVTANSISVTKLTTNTTYQFRVRAYRTVSKKNIYSAGYTTVKATPKLSATSKIVVSKETTSSVTLTWNKVTGATGYQVYNPKTGKWVSTGTKLSYTINSLSANTKYTAKVRAIRKANKKTYNGVEKSISFVTMPAAVKNVKVSNVSTSSLTVSWAKSANATGYRVFLYDYSTKKETMVVDTKNLSATVKGLTAGGKYKVAVRAYTKNTNTIYGAKTYVDNIYAPIVLKNGSGTNATTIQVTWPKTPDATKYVLQRYDSASDSWKTLVSANVTSYSDAVGENTGALYRITSYKNSTALKSAVGEFSTTGIKLAKTTNKVKVTWTAPVIPEDKTLRSYSIYEVNGGVEELVYVIDTNDTTHSMFTAYGEEQTYVIYGNFNSWKLTSADYRTKVAEFTVRAENLLINSTDASKNAQLTMLTDAINRTKYEQNEVTVTQDSTITMGVDRITMSTGMYLMVKLAGVSTDGFEKTSDGYICKGKDNVLNFMNSLEEGSTSEEEVVTTETVSETVTFVTGYNASKYAYLESYIEPSNTAPYTAYLYNGDNVATWDNGFSSVSTTKLSNGNYKVEGTIKAETYGSSTKNASAYYHTGFTASFDGFNFSSTDGMSNSLTKVGATKITAEINPDGKLVSYTIGNTSVDMTLDADMGEDDSGSSMSMGMGMVGSSKFSYKFTR
ncbi:MAG: fibronectin type III domain-containing protein [Clostridia bacterium]|nr:fibronectin type III domain-containing protein [Clostridia bacterium]